MKKLLSASIAAATIASFAVPASADVDGLSATAGFASEYYFRGVNLGDGGAFGSIDYENSGFFTGVWLIDDSSAGNDGLEYDIYLGYGMEHGSFSWSVGLTDYEYTYTSQAQREANAGIALATKVGSFGLDIAVGQDDDNSVDADYTFAALSWSGEVFGVLAGYLDYSDNNDATGAGDYDYSYFEVSAGGEVATVDVGLVLGVKSQDGVQDDGYLVLAVSKTFNL